MSSLALLLAQIVVILAAAHLAGRGTRALGALMNTRGLMELSILNVGLVVGVISPELFPMMVLMALATTAMTSPLLTLLRVDGHARELEPRPRPASSLAADGER